jgi:hypothetical protein
MAELYFRCSNARKTVIDACRAEIDDLAEAREFATCVIQSLIMQPTAEDWRGWILHVSDDAGYEIFALPFASMIGKPH